MSSNTIRLLLLLGTIASCGDAEDTSAQQPPSIPETYHAAQPVANALGVNDLRDKAASGDEVVVRGKVRDIFESAAFTLADLSLVSCADMETDHCPTPWDYCCEDPDLLKTGTAMVEFRDGDRVRKQAVRGFHGLDNLSEVVVSGRLSIDLAGNLSIVASTLHVLP